MKNLLTGLLLLTSINSFACPGGKGIKLNDAKTLYSYALVNTITKDTYYHADDLKNRSQYEYTVSNSESIKTHSIFLQDLGRGQIEITTTNLSSDEEKVYTGSMYQSRGCNELTEITK